MRLLSSLLYQPELTCGHCYDRYKNTKGAKKPMCASGQCAIVDIAPSESLNRKVRAFLQAEAFEMSPGYARFQERLLVESGLAEETPETMIELKSVLADYRAREKKKSDYRQQVAAAMRTPPPRDG